MLRQDRDATVYAARSGWRSNQCSTTCRILGSTIIPYPNKKVALRAAEAMGKKHGVHFSVYKCAWCDGWHIGKNAQNKIKSDALEDKALVSEDATSV